MNFKGTLRITLLAACLLSIFALLGRPGFHAWTRPQSVPLASNDPNALLAAANRLSWLGNWYAAGPLYGKSERLFQQTRDNRNEIYARIGRIRAQAVVVPFDQTLSLLDAQLREPIANNDAKLRLWCLALKGYTELDFDSASAKRDWSEVLRIATSLNEKQWAARAKGELGIIAFLEGKTASAVSLLGKAILSAYTTGDVASQVRLLSMLGNGFNEEHRFAEALTMFRRAVRTAEQTPDAGFPYLAYRGEAAALLGLHQPEEGREALMKALSKARVQNTQGTEAELLLPLGETDLAAEKMEEAKADFQKAQRIAEQMRIYRTLANAAFDLANLERRAGDLKSAGRSINVAMNASRHLGDRYYVPRDLTALAVTVGAHFKISERFSKRLATCFLS